MRKSSKNRGIPVAKAAQESGWNLILSIINKLGVCAGVYKLAVCAVRLPWLSHSQKNNFMSVKRAFIPAVHKTYNKYNLNKFIIVFNWSFK